MDPLDNYIVLNSGARVEVIPGTQVGVNLNVIKLAASEILSAGDFVNIWNDNGISKVRLATSSSIDHKADGYVNFNHVVGDIVLVQIKGNNQFISTNKLGAVYLSEIPGKVTGSLPAIGSNLVTQKLGIAYKLNSMNVDIVQPDDYSLLKPITTQKLPIFNNVCRLPSEVVGDFIFNIAMVYTWVDATQEWSIAEHDQISYEVVNGIPYLRFLGSYDFTDKFAVVSYFSKG